MGKPGKWIKNFLTGKKHHKEKELKEIKNGSNCDEHNPTSTPVVIIPQAAPTTKEKRRWSFRRSPATVSNPAENVITNTSRVADLQYTENDAKKHAMAVAVASAAAAEAAVAAARAAAVVVRLTDANSGRGGGGGGKEAAVIKIQSAFRAYLARKALNALKGLVKLQAIVRGHLVRKQATATLRAMQALVTAQTRAQAHRRRMSEENNFFNQRQFNPRKSMQENRSWTSNQDFDRCLEENIKIVEMDHGSHKPVTKARNSYSNHSQTEPRISTPRPWIKKLLPPQQMISPSPSSITNTTPRTHSNHYEEYTYHTPQGTPQYYSAISKNEQIKNPFSYQKSECAVSLYNQFHPNYMSDTESSKARVRSYSAPKQRPVDSFEKQTIRRRASLEGRNLPRGVRMQRSSSNVGLNGKNSMYSRSVKLDRSTVSVKESECGSTSTMLSNANYCRSLVGFDVQGGRY